MIYFESATLNRCLISLPDAYDEKNTYPLVVGLHGGGGTPEKMIDLWDQISNRNFIYAVPQAPYPFVHNQDLIYDWAMWPSQDEALIQKATVLTEKYIQDAVQEITTLYNIRETYLMGFSQGAIFTYIIGIKHHHLFDGLICLSGPGLLSPLKNPFVHSMGAGWLAKDFIKDAKHLRVMITHGKNDQAANYELGLQSKQILENHGYEVTFYDFDGGHTYPPAPILDSIAQWVVGSE